ncbi:hypothetical protein [Burkholderia cenocepacia]|uniref:hypothetical protein n=1 Tax=Burkholderia cenocepacia TaxID=95486 RepID=UPI0015883A97|nr:hypothetical protein [Burkholderia cenocepacia]
MSIQAMAWAIEQQIVTDPPARHLLLCLSNYADHLGRSAFPSAATLMRDTRLSRATLWRKLAVLEDSGAIKPGNQKVVAAYIDRSDKRPVCYDIVMCRLDDSGMPVDEVAGSHAETSTEPAGSHSETSGVSHRNGRGLTVRPNPGVNRHITVNSSTKSKGVGEAGSAKRPSKREQSIAFLVEQGVDMQHAADWMTARNGKEVTVTVWEAVQREAEKVGMTPAQAVQYAAGASWQGFRADWFLRNNGGAKQQAPSRRDEQRTGSYAALFPNGMPGQAGYGDAPRDDRTIDGDARWINGGAD